MSVNLQNKIILASVSRSQVPANFKEYLCDLIIEEDIEVHLLSNWDIPIQKVPPI